MRKLICTIRRGKTGGYGDFLDIKPSLYTRIFGKKIRIYLDDYKEEKSKE